MSSDTAGRTLKSIAWKYFRIKDKELKLANCKICQNLLSYRTSVTNLIKHVKRKHNKSLIDVHEDISDKSENGEVSNVSLSETDDDDLEDNKEVKVLESLENKNEQEAVCLLCQETFPEQSSNKLMKHMRKVHNISQMKLIDGNIHLEQEEDKPVQNTRTNRSRCWDYFTVKNKDLKLAVCNFCAREFSYKSCVSNLIKHVQRKHRLLSNQRQDLYGGNSREKVNYNPKSVVWSFFKYVNYEKTVCACVHCKKEFRVVDGLDHMKKHLLEEHPEALLHHKSIGDPLFLTTSTETDMEASDDNLQVDFLDFYDVRSSRDSRPGCTQSSTSERERGRRTRKPSIYRSPSRSVTQTKPPESLEHFANYVTYLLQELPEKVSKRLQMNFVKQIIEAQISCDEMKNAAKETVVNTTSDVADTVPDDNIKIIVDEYAVSEETTTANIDKSDGTVTISNGITIRPIRMQ